MITSRAARATALPPVASAAAAACRPHALLLPLLLPPLLLLLLALAPSAAARPPHIVLIVADDLGFDDASLRGADQIPTPNVDALALTGVSLRRYYVHQLCTPSRAALLTGRLATHTGLQSDVIYAAEPYGLALDERTLAQLLQPLGYRCHAVGKWHLGFFRAAYTPTRRGFHSHFGYWTGHTDYYDHTAAEGRHWGLDLRRALDAERDALGHYATGLFTAEAERLIGAHNATQPLFLYLAHQAVHAGNSYAPLQAPAAARARFPWIADERRRTFAAMLSELDESVGRVVAALEAAAMLNDTVIVFTTDNGGAVDGVDKSASSNWPLRGGKYTLWEGGVRGTAFAWGAALRGGRVESTAVHVTDWLPTLYEAAGGRPSELDRLDGISQWQVLTGGEPPAPLASRHILHNIDPHTNYSALMSGRFKLVTGQPFPYNGWYGWAGRNDSGADLFALQARSPAGRAASQLGMSVTRQQAQLLREQLAVGCGQPPAVVAADCSAGCLFDVEADPCELADLSSSRPELRQGLEQLLAQYWRSMVPPRKVPEDPRADPRFWGYTWTTWMDFLDPQASPDTSTPPNGSSTPPTRPSAHANTEFQMIMEE